MGGQLTLLNQLMPPLPTQGKNDIHRVNMTMEQIQIKLFIFLHFPSISYNLTKLEHQNKTKQNKQDQTTVTCY